MLTDDAAAVWICIECRAVTEAFKGYTFYPVSFIDLSKSFTTRNKFIRKAARRKFFDGLFRADI